MVFPDISLEELPETYQLIARIVGIEKAIELAQYLGGQVYYFPKLDSIVRKKRDEAILREFSGFNQAELSKKYNLSEQQIRNILKKTS